MNGVRVATLVVGMMLLAPHGASAQSSCMCADTGLELPLSEAEAELLQDALDDAEHQGVLMSRDELEVARLVLAPPLDSDELPWCTNQNDPQCSKRPAGSVPSLVSIGSSPLFALSVPPTLPSPSSIDCDFAEYSCGGPRDAMRSKLERPPQ